jgi:hypothetical protein
MALTPVYEYFAMVSQQAMDVKLPFRGKVEMLHFGDYVLIKSEIAGQTQRRWFHKERPIFYYHLPKELRRPIVIQMYHSGCSAKEIAEMIGLSVSTITLDVKELKAHQMLFSQIKSMDVTPKDLILKSTINQKPRQFNPANRDWLS